MDTCGAFEVLKEGKELLLSQFHPYDEGAPSPLPSALTSH